MVNASIDKVTLLLPVPVTAFTSTVDTDINIMATETTLNTGIAS